MSRSCNEIIRLIEQKYPTQLAESYDNVGLLLGDPETRVNKILVCLDINENVVEYSIKNKIDMIISHHPLIFKAMKHIILDSYMNNMIYTLIGAKIAVYALHTNFDNADDGMNDILADIIGLSEIKKLYNEKGTGRFGSLEAPMTLEQLCQELKSVFRTDAIRLIGDPKSIVRQAAVIGGAGADFIDDAAEAGCDVLITGDVKYHSALEALYSGINIIDAGHYNTESAAMPYLAEKISVLTGLDVICAPYHSDPFSTL